MIAIINYGLGNLASIKNMCKRLSIDAIITNDPSDIVSADRILLPGVGHFKRGMENLKESGLVDLLNEEVVEKQKPILGICLGAQLLTHHSEEGDVDGLGWVNAKTVSFDKAKLSKLPVPHMGWSDINVIKGDKILKDIPEDPRYYFVHSYHFLFRDQSEVTATCNYGYEFACAFNKGNIFGAQFHPEKSHKYGMKILENFNNIEL